MTLCDPFAKADVSVYAAGICSKMLSTEMSRHRRNSQTNIRATETEVHPLAHRVKLKAYQHFLFLQGDVCGLLRYEKLMVVVHVISGDSPLVHITGINSRVRIMVLNLQARTLTCSSHTCTHACRHARTHAGTHARTRTYTLQKLTCSRTVIDQILICLDKQRLLMHCAGQLPNMYDNHVLQLEGPSGTT